MLLFLFIFLRQYTEFLSWWKRVYEALRSKYYFIRPHSLCFSTTLTSFFKMSDIVHSSKSSFVFSILSLLIAVSMHSAFQLWKLYFCHIFFLFLGPCEISPKKEVYLCLFTSVWRKNRADCSGLNVSEKFCCYCLKKKCMWINMIETTFLTYLLLLLWGIFFLFTSYSFFIYFCSKILHICMTYMYYF